MAKQLTQWEVQNIIKIADMFLERKSKAELLKMGEKEYYSELTKEVNRYLEEADNVAIPR